jgi:hypothetical protein
MQYFAIITIEDILVFTNCGFSASNYNVSLLNSIGEVA